MKNTGDLFSKICDMDNLKKAHKNAKKGKGWYQEVKQVDQNLEKALLHLQDSLIEHTYKTSKYKIFYKKEGKKEREIYKLPYYPDRICQWAILQVIEPYLLKTMITDTYSAIPKRGIQPIINDLRGYTKVIKKNGEVIGKRWVKSILVSDPENTELIWLLDEIIDSISTCPATEENLEILQRLGVYANVLISDDGREYVDGVGIPIGNYLSQYSGNYNLSPLGHWLKEEKKVKYLYFYMDDIVILGGSKEELHKLKREIDEFMAVNLKQVLKSNWQVFPSKVRGIDFVGYRFFGEYILLRKSTCKTFKRKMLAISAKRENNMKPTYSEWCSFNSYKGWLKWCDSFRLTEKYIKPVLDAASDYYFNVIKKRKVVTA